MNRRQISFIALVLAAIAAMPVQATTSADPFAKYRGCHSDADCTLLHLETCTWEAIGTRQLKAFRKDYPGFQETTEVCYLPPEHTRLDMQANCVEEKCLIRRVRN